MLKRTFVFMLVSLFHDVLPSLSVLLCLQPIQSKTGHELWHSPMEEPGGWQVLPNCVARNWTKTPKPSQTAYVTGVEPSGLGVFLTTAPAVGQTRCGKDRLNRVDCYPATVYTLFVVVYKGFSDVVRYLEGDRCISGSPGTDDPGTDTFI